MSTKERTAEQVCIAYYEISRSIAKISHIISLRSCELEHHHEPTVEHCLTRLFQIKRDGGTESEYEEEVTECEDSLCDSCIETLKLIRERRKIRVALGAKKRAIGLVGKRLWEKEKERHV